MSASLVGAISPAVEKIAERVRSANETRRPFQLSGAGTWKSCCPADASEELPLRELDGIVEYVPGDLTITVGAGVTLSAIERETAQHNQWLTLDPYGSADGTIGATVASACSGPLSTGFGTPRDAVIGIEAVMGRGSVVRAGGRVVKNVAGFDITRLLTGSRGTIGAITEVSLRLRGRPAADSTIAIVLPEKPGAVQDAIAAMKGWPASPMAAELLDTRAAAAIDLPGVTLLVRFGGNARLVAAMKKRAGLLGKTAQLEAEVWRQVRALGADAPVCFRIADRPTAFVQRWEDAQAFVGKAGMTIGSPLRGTVRCTLPSLERAAMTAFRARIHAATLVYDSLPGLAAWNSFTSVPAASTLHARVMEAFDPIGIMNPGSMRLAR